MCINAAPSGEGRESEAVFGDTARVLDGAYEPRVGWLALEGAWACERGSF